MPENSRAAFEAAVRADYPIELDVHCTRDGEVVVFHDDDLRRMTGQPGRVTQTRLTELVPLRLAQTSEGIPRLARVLELVRGRVPVLVELKASAPIGRLESAVCDVLQSYRGEYAVQSFNPWSMHWMQRHAPHLPRGLLAGGMEGLAMPLAHRWALRTLAFAPYVRPHFVGYELWALPAVDATRWRRRGEGPLLAWTVRDTSEWARSCTVADNLIFENIRPRR